MSSPASSVWLRCWSGPSTVISTGCGMRRSRSDRSIGILSMRFGCVCSSPSTSRRDWVEHERNRHLHPSCTAPPSRGVLGAAVRRGRRTSYLDGSSVAQLWAFQPHLLSGRHGRCGCIRRRTARCAACVRCGRNRCFSDSARRFLSKLEGYSHRSARPRRTCCWGLCRTHALPRHLGDDFQPDVPGRRRLRRDCLDHGAPMWKLIFAPWHFEPMVVAAILVTAALYWRGHSALHRASAVAFYAGLATIAVALLSPVDDLADALFSGHMAQHLPLILLAAPLLAISRAGAVLFLALPRQLRMPLSHAASWLPRAWRPVTFWLVFIAIFLFWHLPQAYGWARESEAVHISEHLTLLLSACAFWSVIFASRARAPSFAA